MRYSNEVEALKNSRWPKCDVLAEELAAHGDSAADALEAAASSRTHHVRSAVLRNLSKLSPSRGEELARKLLLDKAYEVRETASKILGVPING